MFEYGVCTISEINLQTCFYDKHDWNTTVGVHKEKAQKSEGHWIHS